MDDFKTVMTLLGSPEGQSETVQSVIDLTKSRLKNLLGVAEVPDALSFIVPEVSVIRFNRIGSEGIKAHTVGGESMTFSDDDFLNYEKDISAWKAQNEALGTVFFL